MRLPACLDEYSATATYISLPPLFKDKQEYENFHARHLKASVPCVPFGADCGRCISVLTPVPPPSSWW